MHLSEETETIMEKLAGGGVASSLPVTNLKPIQQEIKEEKKEDGESENEMEMPKSAGNSEKDAGGMLGKIADLQN